MDEGPDGGYPPSRAHGSAHGSAHGPAQGSARNTGTRPRTQTERHSELVETLGAELRSGRLDPDSPRHWATTALHACLAHLLTSEVTEAGRVSVIDAWLDDTDALCIVYVPPFDDERIVGVRRTRQDAAFPDYWRLGDRTGWGYELGGVHGGEHRGDHGGKFGAASDDVDPVAFGWNVADFDVGEPLGFVTTILRHDAADVGWWGDLGDVLPRPTPDAD